MQRCVAIICATLLAGSAVYARAQSVRGIILRDSIGTPLAGVEVSVPAQNKRTSTDERGAFRIDGLTAGRYAILARRLGLNPMQDTVDLVAGDTTRWDTWMSAAPQMLDSVQVKSEQRRYVSPALNGFEERRASGFGRFISEPELRKQENEKLADVLRILPGAMLVRGPGGNMYFTSSRKPCDGPVFLPSAKCAQGTADCYVTIYLDGILFYSPPPVDFVGGSRTASNGEPPDINKVVPVTELAGVEYYASDAMLPPKFTSGANGCGTVLLWTRER